MVDSESKLTTLGNLFSKLSITLSGLTLILIVLLVKAVPSTIKAREGFPVISKLLVGLTETSCLLGVIFSIVSLVRKEKLKYWKIIGFVLNILLFLFLIGTLGFSVFMDWKRGK